VDTGLIVLGMATTDKIPAQTNVNTALRSSFFTVVLLSSVRIPWGILYFFLLFDRGRFDPEQKAGSELRGTCPIALVQKCIESNVKRKFICILFQNPELQEFFVSNYM
jgi:hypothetical protein